MLSLWCVVLFMLQQTNTVHIFYGICAKVHPNCVFVRETNAYVRIIVRIVCVRMSLYVCTILPTRLVVVDSDVQAYSYIYRHIFVLAYTIIIKRV